MKICAHCTTENRNEAIFCRQCRHALRASRAAEDVASRSFRRWIFGMLVLIGLSMYVFSPGRFRQTTAAQMQDPNSNGLLTPIPTQTEEPITLSACVTVTTHIRRGPGTNYETTGGLGAGSCMTVIGRNSEGNWGYVVSEDHQTGWVDTSLLNDSWGINKVSIREEVAMANPGRATLTSQEIAYGAQVYLTKVAATNLPQSPLTQYVTPCFETASRVGDHISCKLERAVCDYLPDAEGSPTICNDRPYPDHNFALIVPGRDWSEFDRECIIVSGFLKINKGVLQIQAEQRSQVSFCK